MITQQMRSDYNDYLHTHIQNVRLGLSWMIGKLPEVVAEFDADTLGEVGSQHDHSKYDTEEWGAYCEYFYGDSKNEDVLRDFDYAWLHHQHNNPHHWQHWLLREDDGDTKAMEMPKIYALEMIADWWAFSWKADNLYEIFNWYEKNVDKIVLHENTKAYVEDVLSRLKAKLDEVHGYGNKE